MDLTDLLLRALGAFYVFAGVVASRAALMNRMLDTAIAAIGGAAPSRAETARNTWHLASAALVLASGVALLLLLDISLWLFLASAAGQALYLFWIAPRHLDPDDPIDPTGRRQTLNAFIIYLIATALIAWAASEGRLASLRDAPLPALALGGTMIAAYLVYVVRSLSGQPKPLGPLFGGDDGASALPEARAQSKRIKLMPEPGSHPLWALDDGIYGEIDPVDLGLSDDLQRDLAGLSDRFESYLDPDEPGRMLWADDERLAYQDTERALARRLAHELSGRTIYVVDSEVGLVEVPGT